MCYCGCMGAIICADFIGIPCMPQVPTLDSKHQKHIQGPFHIAAQQPVVHRGRYQIVGRLPPSVCVHVHACMCTCVCVCMHAVSCWCVCVHLCVCACACMLSCVHVCVRVCAVLCRIGVCVCMHAHTYMYIRLCAPLFEQSGCSLPTLTWIEVCMQHIHFQRPLQHAAAFCFQV